jgi:hypothetical protein
MNDSNEKLQEYEIVSNGSLSGGGELYTIAGDARTCYICGGIQCLPSLDTYTGRGRSRRKSETHGKRDKSRHVCVRSNLST